MADSSRSAPQSHQSGDCPLTPAAERLETIRRSCPAPIIARRRLESREGLLVVPDNIHDFFTTSGAAAGALIGLLFVAISVSAGRLEQQTVDAQLHRIRASASFTAFTNALAVSLFSLIPGHKIGPTAVVVACFGLFFVLASLVSMLRRRHLGWKAARDTGFILGLAVVFVIQFCEGVDVWIHPADSASVDTIAMLVVICFLIGVARAWELIRGPEIGLVQEVSAYVKAGPDEKRMSRE
jgi:hypothetical protein